MVLIRKGLLNLRTLVAEKFSSALTGYEKKAPVFLSYFSTLFFVEILYFMVMILVIYGRTAAVLFGFLAALMVTLHVIGLFFRKTEIVKFRFY